MEDGKGKAQALDIALHLLQAFGERAKEVSGGQVAAGYQRHELSLSDAHGLGCEAERARQAVAELTAQLFHLDDALAGDLAQGIQRATHILCRQAQ